jgi:hypothetical protein
VGDRYEIRRPLILLDQPGRGQGDLIAGNPPRNIAVSPARPAWPHNALEPTYSWNNTYVPTGASVDLTVNPTNVWIEVEGRDFYNNTPMPGYKAYVYPHPLARPTGKADQARKKS